MVGDLSAQRFNRPQSLCHPYRRVPPLEMTTSAGSIQSFPERQIDQNAAPPRHFDESVAEWRNLTPKCGKPRVAGDLSTLRFIRAQSLCPIPARSSARDDGVGGQHTVISRGTNCPKRCPDRQTAACLGEWSFEALAVQHPRATLWPSPPQGNAIQLSVLHKHTL